MAVSTISNDEKPFSTALIYFLGVLGVALVVFFGGELIRNLTGLGSKSALEVDVENGVAQVLINDKVVGDTPFRTQNIKPGQNIVTVRNEQRQYQTELKFLPSKNEVLYTTVIIRDLGISDTFSSGQESWFEKDGSENTVRIVSEPSGATVFIDGSDIGTTPFSSGAITSGEYDLAISFPGYRTERSRISIQKGYTLNISAKLFPIPVTPSVDVFEGSENLYNVTIDNPRITSDTRDWVKGLIYWNITEGINIDNVGLNREKVFDYFIDYLGNIYDMNGNPVVAEDDFERLRDLGRGAYLGTPSTGEGITTEARQALETLSNLGVEPVKISSSTAKIKPTPLGWLRVRQTPSLNGTELTRVNSGNTYNVLDEQEGWVKIKVSETIEGWVSSTYVELSE
ncbi:PEGA domain-containing protein [Patescibacteria group bacterium]|nr:PEGA domain-containing protein [Patescibacteria group bacterium]